MRHPSSAVPAVAEHQAGTFSVAQAVAEGWSPRTIRRRREDRVWRVVAGRGLTADPGPPGAHALAWAAQLTWPDVVVAGPTAAAIWGWPVAADACVHVITSRGRSAAGITTHVVGLDPSEIDVLDGGICVTSPRRTAVDCLALLELAAALDLYAWLSTHGRLTRHQLSAATRSRLGRHGTPQLVRLLQITRTGAVSGAEYRFHGLLQTAGVQGWRANVAVHDAQGCIGVVDVLFVAARLVIEVDGERAHTGRAAFVADRHRQNRLVAAGYTVLRFTWWDIVDRPDHVVAQVRAALATAGDHR
jgi:hypothetical protein